MAKSVCFFCFFDTCGEKINISQIAIQYRTIYSWLPLEFSATENSGKLSQHTEQIKYKDEEKNLSWQQIIFKILFVLVKLTVIDGSACCSMPYVE